MKTRNRKLHMWHVLVFWLVCVAVALFAIRTADASAAWRCSQLQDQADAFELFTLSETEEEMCASVEMKIRLQVDPDEMQARQEELKNADSTAPRLVIPEDGGEPTWYKAQQYAKAKDTAYLNLAPKLKRICACESAGNPDAVPQQYEQDGVTVLRGRVTPNDIGLCQISLDYWGKEAERLGLDLFDPHDNVAMANHIYEKQGAQPWYPSKGCHGYE